MHCMWKCESWTLNTSEGSLPVRRVNGQRGSWSRQSAALDDVTEGSSSLFLLVFFPPTQSVICPQLDKMMASHLPSTSSDPLQPWCIVGEGHGRDKSVRQTSWQRYRSTASWTGRAETQVRVEKIIHNIYNWWTSGGGSGLWFKHDVTNSSQTKRIEFGQNNSEKNKPKKQQHKNDLFAAWNSVIDIFGAFNIVEKNWFNFLWFNLHISEQADRKAVRRGRTEKEVLVTPNDSQAADGAIAPWKSRPLRIIQRAGEGEKERTKVFLLPDSGCEWKVEV